MTNEPAMSTRDAIAIGLMAMLLRAAICVTILFARHISIDQYARNGDGASYLAMARAMLGDASTLTEYDRRVFPGYPAMIALFGLARVSLPVAALAIDWGCAGVAAGLAALLFRDRRIGLAMVVLLPQYVINSSLAMSEAPLLALSLAGIWLTLRGTGWRTVAGGFALGLAGLVRPMACFAAAGCLVALLVRKQPRRAAIMAIGAGIAAVAGLMLVHRWTGDVLRGVRIYKNSPQAYTGHLFAWPFESLICTPFREGGTVEGWSIPYIWGHVLILGIACVVLVKRWRIGWPRTRLATRLSSSKSGEAAKCGKC